MVTLAPERDGALEAIDLLVRNGIIAAVGHTDATWEQTRAAIAAGATVGTHVFNGMRPPHHRQPGPVFALLAAPSVVCEFVADGHHLHDGTLAFATTVTGPDRAAEKAGSKRLGGSFHIGRNFFRINELTIQDVI